jgi:adenylate kinase
LLFGPPGSGKGTQATFLGKALKMPHVSTGDIFRQQVNEGTELGLQVKQIMESGQLVPDELVNRIVLDRLERPDCAAGFILDGYPRTLEQAQMLDTYLQSKGIAKVVINLTVGYNVIVKRLAARRSCPVCGTVYNLDASPPRKEGVCDRDGTPLIQREDDKEEVIRKRFEAYDAQTLPVIDFFQSNGYRILESGGEDEFEERTAKLMVGLKKNG